MKYKKQKDKIKAIIFDIDGVVIFEDRSKLYTKLIKKFRLDWKKFRDARRKHIKSALLGKIAEQDYYSHIIKDLEIKEEKQFVNIWKNHLDSTMKLDENMEKILIKLKKNYIVGALTNVSRSHERPRILNNIYKHFKHTIRSFQVKIIKPNRKIYKLLIKRLKLNPGQIIFIDNDKKNVISARKLKINAILFKNRIQLIKDLKKLGIKLK